MALKAAAKKGKRVKQLTKDTAVSVHHTCYGLVELYRYLLATSHRFICLGNFTTNFQEKEFCRLRQGSGGTYFISLQQGIEIKQSSLLISLNKDLE